MYKIQAQYPNNEWRTVSTTSDANRIKRNMDIAQKSFKGRIRTIDDRGSLVDML